MSSLFRLVLLNIILLNPLFLAAGEWKQEVRRCGEEVCFVLVGEEESKFLGSATWPDEVFLGGKEMAYQIYFFEGVPVSVGQEDDLHVYRKNLEPIALEWADTGSTSSFLDFLQEKCAENPSFVELLHAKTVRYFTDKEREQTQIHWIDGTLWQIGLDNSENEISPIPPGSYAFVLGKEQMFLAKKEQTPKGRIQHSSFLRGGPARAAGKLHVGLDGQIVSISDQSGHYKPGDSEIYRALNFIKEKIPHSAFERILVKTKSNKTKEWNLEADQGGANGGNLAEINLEEGVPAVIWFNEFHESE